MEVELLNGVEDYGDKTKSQDGSDHSRNIIRSVFNLTLVGAFMNG